MAPPPSWRGNLSQRRGLVKFSSETPSEGRAERGPQAPEGARSSEVRPFLDLLAAVEVAGGRAVAEARQAELEEHALVVRARGLLELGQEVPALARGDQHEAEAPAVRAVALERPEALAEQLEPARRDDVGREVD